MSWKLRPRARNGGETSGCLVFLFFLAIIGLLTWTLPTLIMLGILVIFGILNSFVSAAGEPIVPAKKEDTIKYGIRGGRYEIRYSQKTGKPYRHYF